MVSPPPRTQHPPLPVPIQVRPRGRTAPAKPWMPSSMGTDPPSSPSAWSLLLIWAGGDPCVPLVCLSPAAGLTGVSVSHPLPPTLLPARCLPAAVGVSSPWRKPGSNWASATSSSPACCARIWPSSRGRQQVEGGLHHFPPAPRALNPTTDPSPSPQPSCPPGWPTTYPCCATWCRGAPMWRCGAWGWRWGWVASWWGCHPAWHCWHCWRRPSSSQRARSTMPGTR